MAHYRKLNYLGREFLYNIGKQFTVIRGLGQFKNSEYGARHRQRCEDDVYVITPRIVKRMIEGKTNDSPIFYCEKHGHYTSELVTDAYYLAARDVKALTPACPQCNHEQYMRS